MLLNLKVICIVAALVVVANRLLAAQKPRQFRRTQDPYYQINKREGFQKAYYLSLDKVKVNQFGLHPDYKKSMTRINSKVFGMKVQ